MLLSSVYVCKTQLSIEATSSVVIRNDYLKHSTIRGPNKAAPPAASARNDSTMQTQKTDRALRTDKQCRIYCSDSGEMSATASDTTWALQEAQSLSGA